MSIKQLACLGGKPLFEKSVPVGQLYFPDWDKFRNSMDGIFERQFYTNQGPLTQEFEKRISDFLGVKHAICVTNATIGLMMSAEALQLKGKVIVPSFTFIATILSLKRCNLKPVFCDVDYFTHHITPTTLERTMQKDVSAVLGVNLWGSTADVEAVEEWASRHGIICYWDSSQTFGCSLGNNKIGNFGSLEVFSFHATKVLSSMEGGCITTNDDKIAARLRNIRSSYGAGYPVEVVKTSNGRMSEFQAAVGLLSLENFYKYQKNNELVRETYTKELQKIKGVTLENIHGANFSNHQSIVVRINPEFFGASRNVLMKALHCENVLARRYFHPGNHHLSQFDHDVQIQLNNTDRLIDEILVLPSGQPTSIQDIEKICSLISEIKNNIKAVSKLVTY